MENITNFVSILYVEDEADVREGYSRALARLCSDLYTAENGKEGLELYRLHMPQIVVSDIKMPIMNGIEMAKAIKKINPEVNIIFTSAHSESAYMLEAIELQVEGYLLKPVQKNQLTALIKKIAKNIFLERQYNEQRKMLQHIIDSDERMTIITDISKFLFASRSLLNFFEAKETEELNKRFGSVLDLFAQSKNRLKKEHLEETMQNGHSLFDIVSKIDESERVITLSNSHAIKEFLISVSKIGDNCLISLTDITKIQRDREVNDLRAHTDSLTGIANRVRLEEFFDERAYATAKTPLTIALLDIDHFKQINDTYGHLVGDAILKELTRVVASHIRESDLFARWGGEEFVILFNNITLEHTLHITEKLRRIIEESPFESIGRLTVSFGISEMNPQESLSSLIERADSALYRAKKSGRNRIEHS